MAMQLVTDPDILRQLNGPDVPSASSGAPIPSDASSSAPPAMSGMTRVTDPDLLRQLNADQPTPGVRFRDDGSPTDVRNTPTAASDPIYHGAVPIAQAPDQGATTAFASGVQGAPIIGPAIDHAVKAAAAFMRSKANGTSYDTEMQHVEDMANAARAQHPVAAFAGDLTGATSALAPAVEMAPAAFGAGGGGLTAGQVASGAATGATIGGADAAVRSDGDPDAIKLGAAGGAFGGAAGPIFAAGLSRAASGAADYLGRVTGRSVPGLSPAATDVLTRALGNDDALGPQGAARLQSAGPQAMLADAGPATAGALDTAMQRGGPGALAARQAIENRAAGADQDLTVHLDRALGAPQGLNTAETAIRDGSAAARQAAYDAAYSSPIDYTTDAGRSLEAMVQNRVPPGIIARANAQMRMDGTPSQQIMMRVQPDGSVTFDRMPDVRQIDYITRSLNDVARAGDGQGALGGNTAEGRSYGNLARDLRTTLRQAVPQYDQALQTAAEPIQARNALEFGSEILRSTVPRDVAVDRVADMTGPELAQARAGLRSQIAETLANVQRTITDPNVDARQAMALVKQLSSDAAQQKMALLVPQSEAAAMSSALTRSTRALELRASVATNSRTFGRLATDAAVKDATAPGVVGTLLEGKPLQVPQAALRYVTGRRPADIARREDSIYGEVAGALTGRQGPQAMSMLDQIARLNDRRQSFSLIADGIPFGALSQTGILALLPALNQPRAQ